MYTKEYKDFYPTPKHLAKKMFFSLDFTMINSILEPSAGKGNLIEPIKEQERILSDRWNKFNFDIDCIEMDSDLQHILQGKGYRLVHDDFLTYETMKEYDLIVMNPPFSNGCKHLLKALDMQKRNGGAIVCLLNAETLKNQCSNERITLARALERYEASIEYFQDAFTGAERTANVEVALIKVQLPKIHRDSFIFDELKKAVRHEENQEHTTDTQIAENDLYQAITKQYELEVRAGIKLIKEYHAMSPYIMAEFGKDDKTGEVIQKGSCILELDLSKNKDKYKNELSINSFIREVRGKYWEALFHNDKFIGQLTENLRQDFYNRLKDLKDYEFSLYNIYELKIQMQKKVVKGVEDTIIALFDELSQKYYWDDTSSNIHYYNGWKANKSWIINNKVIIPLSGWDDIWKKFRLADYKIIQKLQDIEKCFNYLDCGLTDAIDLKLTLKAAEDNGKTRNIGLKYFTVTFYKKGTCHIAFKNPELLKKFNIFGSQKKGWLPPSYGKKSYKDMTSEEREVINEFEGEEEYNKVMRKTDYYLFKEDNLNLLEEKTA